MAITIRDVQQATHNAGSNTLALPAFAVDPSNGDTIIVAYSTWTTTGNQLAPTDSAGNTYTQIGTEVVNSQPEILSLWYSHNVVGGTSFVVTGHLTGNQHHTAVAWLISGDLVYNSDFTSAGGGSGSNPLSTGTSSPAPTAEALFIALMSYDTGTAASDGSGWNDTASHGFNSTLQGRSRLTSFTTVDLYTEYLVDTATAHAATWGVSGTHGFNALVASFSANVDSGTGDVTLPVPTIDGTGDVIAPITGTGAVTLPVPTIDGSGGVDAQPGARVTQVAAEVFGAGPVSARVTQTALEVFGQIGEVVFVNDRTPGLTHIEITMSDGTVEPWSVIPMDDPLTYDYGRKASRVLAWQDIRRSQSDFYGQPVAADFKFTVRDKDLHVLGYLGNPRNVFVNRYTVTKSIGDPDRRQQLQRRVVMRGPIRSVVPRTGAIHEFTIKDYLQERFSSNSDIAALPRRRVLKADFPACAVTKVNSSADGYVSNGGHSIGDTDLTVRGGIGTFSNDQITFAGHATVYSVSASSVAEPDTQITVSPALTADVADGEVITQIPSHQVTPALGDVVPVRAGFLTDFKVIDGEDNGDGQGLPLYVGDEVMPDGHTYAMFLWACHGCYSPAGRPIQMIYFWNGALLTSGFVTYSDGTDIVSHPIGDLATEAGSGGRVLLPGYQNWTDNGFTESYINRNGRWFTAYGLRGILRDMALGVRGAPDNLGGEPHTVNGHGMDSSLNGHGAELRDIHDEFPVAFNNFFWGDWQSGPPLPHPTFPDDPTLTLLDLASLARAKAHAQTLVTGGFVGDWSIGVGNELITMATFIQWMVRCMGVEQGWNRKTQFMIDRLNFDPATAMVGAPTLTDERDISKMSYLDDEAPDENFSAIPFVHTHDEVGRASGGWRSSTADFNVADQVGEYADDPATLLRLNPTGAKAYSQPFEFRLLRGKNTAHDADDAQQGSDTINAILRYKLAMAKVRYFSATTYGKGFDIEMFDRLWIQHIAGIGGRTPRPGRVIDHDAQPDRWKVTLKCFDLEAIYGGTATTVRGTAAVTLGVPTVDAVGTSVTTGDTPGIGDVTISVPTIDAVGDAGENVGAAIPVPSISASGDQTITGTGDAAIGVPTIAAQEAPLDSAVAIPAPSVSGTGTERFTGSGGATIGNPTVQGSNSGGAGGVLIATTDVAQTVINAHPAGTVFTVQAGIHRDSFTPRNGDKYIGEFGAVFSGAVVLSSHSGSNPWAYAMQSQEGPYDTAGGAAYRSGFDASGHPEDLWIDDVQLLHANSFAEGGPGKWYFDYGADIIYIWDNPAGHVVETGVLAHAVNAASVGASYTGIIFEKYATPTQQAAVTLGGGNVMTSCEVRLCHYGGIETGPGSQVTSTYTHHNGVFGFIGSGSGALIQACELAYNNTTGVNGDPFWGAGGSKWTVSDGLQVINCNSHDNDGPGFWTDINNINTLYQGCTSTNNTRAGIFHEISYSARILNCTGTNNGSLDASLFGRYPTGANFAVCSSTNVEISGCTSNDGWWGIGFLQDGRAGPYPDQNHGLWEVNNFNGHNNTVNNAIYTMVGGYGPGDSSWFSTRGNGFSSTTTSSNSHGATYEWDGSSDLAGFHAKGQS